MAQPEALIVFTPSGKRGRFALDTPVLTAARQLGVDVDSVCGGRGICGRCQVTLSEGEFAKHGISSQADHLTPLSEPEQRYAEKSGLAQDRRLSCHTRLRGDVVIDVPATSQVHHQVVRKELDARDIDLDPVVRLHFVAVAEPDMDDPVADLERLYVALEREWELADLTCDPTALRRLQPALRGGEWSVTVAVRGGDEIVGIWPGFINTAYGMAVDVGSTTIAAHLCDLSTGKVAASAGLMNPQIRFGEDLMSRVSYVMMNPGGDQQLTAVVRDAIATLATDVCGAAGVSPTDVLEVTLVGNPVMHHLLLGIDPTPLGTAPFALATERATTLPARQLDLGVHPGARAYLLPCIAGHVGADTAGMLLAEAPYRDEAITLLVDVGTNAELVLGNRERLVAASSPTGPAFEGAQISCGQRAAPGAIERVRIDHDTLEPRFKVIGCELWSNEPEFGEQTRATGITGVCGSGIIEVIAEMYLAGILDEDGAIDGSLAGRSPRIVPDGRTHSYLLHEGEPRIGIVQNDVRAVQLAKGALYAGARLLMERLGVDKVDRIRLAGAFGSLIDVKYAMVLGMIPDCDLSQVSAAGNAAGSGARIALLDASARTEIETWVRRIEKVETAVADRFQHHFVNAMAIPNKEEPFPELAKVVPLPTPKQTTDTDRRPRRSRRRRRPPTT
ncbi:MAG TPA: ASKHA domain-containing protein [Acidobacteriota bacterium]|nr:ASKHA domain-containing protein [Acidobacteriota bacterium]